MNKQVLLAERPVGMPTDSTWTYQTTKIPEILDGKSLLSEAAENAKFALSQFPRNQGKNKKIMGAQYSDLQM